MCKNLFIKYGIPKVKKSDNGPAFSSKEWADFAKKYNFGHQKITPLHPKANSMAERVMKAENKRIRCSVDAKTPWKVEMSNYLKRYNQTPHSATGFSPNMLLLGQDQCDILPNVITRKLTPNMTALALANDARAKASMKKYADSAQNTRHREFSINQPILHRWDRSFKHAPLFDPMPYRVQSIKGSMITAHRLNHTVTRNSSKFKQISKNCFDKLMELTTQNKPKPMNQFHFPRQELHAFENNQIEAHMPPTPISQTINLRPFPRRPNSTPIVAQAARTPRHNAPTPSRQQQRPINSPKTNQAQKTLLQQQNTVTAPAANQSQNEQPLTPIQQQQNAVNDPIDHQPPANIQANQAPVSPIHNHAQRRSTRIATIRPVDYQDRLNKKKAPNI